MKQKIAISFIFFLTTTFAINTYAQTATANTNASASKTSNVDISKSYVGWLAKKIVGQHNGKVKLQEGTVQTKNGILVGGNFIINMNTISCDDLTDPDYNGKLIKHLNGKDFFDVSGFETASLKITKVLKLTKKINTYNLTADLSIKGITKSITFPATFKTVGKAFEGVAMITIDRTMFDIKYGSSNFFDGLGDKAIKNDVELNVVLATN